MFTLINRDALILFPKQPLFDWINAVYDDGEIKSSGLMENDKGRIYLIPEMHNSEEAEVFLQQHFHYFFEDVLIEMSDDESTWPPELTWELFREWFHYSLQSMVLDTVEGAIVKDDDE